MNFSPTMSMEAHMERFEKIETILQVVVAGFILLAVVYFAPWQHITWGKVKVLPGDTITVVGEAKTKQLSQKATFSAGISTVTDTKETAVAEVNKKTEAIIAAVKTFGIPSEDIKTQNLNVYQGEETYYEDGRQKSRPGQWRVNNTIEITLRSVERANDLADVLTQSGANNIYGPNFALDDTGEAEMGLLEEAMKNAREKAATVAKASNRKLGKMVGFSEGYQPEPVYYRMEGGGGGGAGLEPGTGTVTKTVTVTFELTQ